MPLSILLFCRSICSHPATLINLHHLSQLPFHTTISISFKHIFFVPTHVLKITTFRNYHSAITTRFSAEVFLLLLGLGDGDVDEEEEEEEEEEDKEPDKSDWMELTLNLRLRCCCHHLRCHPRCQSCCFPLSN